MPATPLNEAKKYVLFRRLAVVYCETLANPAAPTRPEIDGGTDISAQVDSMTGFEATSNFLEAKRLGAASTVKLPGRSSSADSSIVTHQDKTSAENDVRSVWAEGDDGYVLLFDGGDVVGTTVDVYPVSVGAVNKSRDTEAIAMINTAFGVSGTVHKDIAVPAHAA